MNIVSRLILLPFVVMSLMIWLVLGVFLWIPLIVKISLIYMMEVLSHAIVGKNVSTTSESALYRASTYYVRGFSGMSRILFHGPTVIESDDVDVNFGMFDLLGSATVFVVRTVQIFIISVIFWGGLLVTLQHFRIIEVPQVAEFEHLVGELVVNAWYWLGVSLRGKPS